jgi:ATP-binding cassette subfamily B protein
MLGHRTRRVQEDAGRRDERDLLALSAYRAVSERLDRVTPALLALGVRGWPIVGFAVLVPTIASGVADTASLAVALGTVLLATWSLERLALGLGDLGAARISWDQAQLLVDAAARPDSSVAPGGAPAGSDLGGELLSVQGLSFGYDGRAPVLAGLDATVRRGDQVLLEGASGSGKTTLASVLCGVLDGGSGRVELRGRTRDEWGPAAWRQRVVLAPQFHDNHVLQAPLAFNVLLGRSWPARWSDIDEAEVVLRELGLGPVLDRMPAGMMQLVGESGWQLSHGERSRIFIARALLQRADVVVLDESFGALDPETMQQALDVVARRSPSLVVIAHP